MFDRLYQENWLEQVTTKKGQSNWCIASLCSELVAKMAKDIGMTICKGYCGTIPTLFGCFLGIPSLIMFFRFFKCFFCCLQARRKQILFGPAEQRGRLDRGRLAPRAKRVSWGGGGGGGGSGGMPSEIVSGAILGRNSKSRTTCCQT